MTVGIDDAGRETVVQLAASLFLGSWPHNRYSRVVPPPTGTNHIPHSEFRAGWRDAEVV